MSQYLARPVLFFAALLAGASFWPASHLALPFAAFVAWKTAGLALLALWAGLAARGRDGWLITAVLAFGAVGDAVLEVGRTAGGVVFLAGHLVAIVLYRWNARDSDQTPGALIALAIPALVFVLTRDAGATVYAIGLGGMAWAAWASRFRRDRVGLGALLFASSDVLIFAQERVLAGSIVPVVLIWPLYFAGQALIAYGVVTALVARTRNEDLHHRL